ncbi:hypothetical protein Amet_2236 [Alkaliphilus metalliredigens QYMF]|uniref:Uncharacterized protein n=1 Tax=Alkaliphilus metalliredigens (strain QYMF) TaxID=293826 RepID=A6TQC6_ALKMQ|nr:hypothetical protein [Alkaliphilus metalliredigens]ABR48394.1 hypothetical protein Amet_2236 [Alkaliphilus metalliredigens QYMF]
MTTYELVTLLDEVRKNDGKVYLQYDSPDEDDHSTDALGKLGIRIFTEIRGSTKVPTGIQFDLQNGLEEEFFYDVSSCIR